MSNARILDEAALWIARARDPRFTDWDALCDWLEQDPAHNLAYEAAFAAHDLAEELPSTPEPVVEPVKRSAWRWYAAGSFGAAAAASLALLIPGASPSPIVIETRPGQLRVIDQPDGTKIALNGATRIVLNADNARTARLERGEAMFDVVHDEAKPFAVDVGGERLIDLGTRFDVVRGAHGSEVAVAQGLVLYDPEGAAVRLGAGRRLRKQDHSQLLEVSDVDASAVGDWRSGRLVYRETPLSRVAEDLGRLTGESVDVAPTIARRSFTGVLVVPASDRRTFFERLARLLDLEVASRKGGYYLKAREGS